jgi:ubiquinone/menaquinone biosynthesis C-methylase UbiE
LGQARSYAKASGVTLASITQGDARQLDFPAGSADAALLLGPLYHLVERPDRLQALLEARRVLRPRGVLFAASISRFASLIDGLSRGFFQDAEFRKIVEADLTYGLHRNPNPPASILHDRLLSSPRGVRGRDWRCWVWRDPHTRDRRPGVEHGSVP